MTNADKFKGIFGIYATELWAKSEKEFLEWLNEDVPDTNVGDMISRQDAIDAVEYITSSMSVCVNSDECHGMKRMQRQAVIELANLPSADAVEIVRCKDCKHRYHSVECPCQSYDHFYSWTPADDWFCKKGERKEE